MMKKTKLIRGGIMALFVLAALLLVYLVVSRRCRISFLCCAAATKRRWRRI